MFNIKYNAENGGLESLIIKGDEYEMNWVESQTATFGVPYIKLQVAFNRFMGFEIDSVNINNDICNAVYSNPCVRIEVKRENSEKYREEYTITNTSPNELFFPMGDLGIDMPFNDNYEDAETCLTKRCNTHLWCGENSSYIMALRMGASVLNTGLMVTKGSIGGYTQITPPYAKNDRGDFRLDFSPFSLLPGESYTFSHEMFVFADKADFYSKIREYENFIYVDPDEYTVFLDKYIDIKCYYKGKIKDFKISANGVDANAAPFKDGIRCVYKCDTLGEIRFDIEINGLKTHALIFVSPSLDKLLEKRIEFIVDKQQYHKEGSALDGAYLLYDNETDSVYFNNMVSDHNASRERLGMGIVIAKYLQHFENEKFYNSLMEYKSFVFREFCDTQTGEVFDTIGKDATQVRLYNAPWVCVFCCELYNLTKEKEYLEIMFRVMKHYYENGGDKFYPNGITIYEPIELLRKAEMETQAQALFEYAVKHCENMMEYGVFYPKHEVDYEQTIVTPAVTFMLSLYRLTGEEKYLENAKLHLENLERFDSLAPDYHLYQTPIRHWDDYWFGKEQTFGDTFPHYWSVLSGWAYYLMPDKTMKYKLMAEENIKNCLCLFTPCGRASCAYLYPHRIGEKKGKLYDSYANDQDFALYFAMKIFY
ncbi:MAG: hypothetical protein IKU52_04935 [Clostridia bacterium]|nr:hypothetical protein [Clostridia bacterium]